MRKQTNGPGRDPAKERFWRRIMARWERSRQTIRAFCGDEELSEASFHAWRRELRRRDDERADGITQPAAKARRSAAASRRPAASTVERSSFVPLQLIESPAKP